MNISKNGKTRGLKNKENIKTPPLLETYKEKVIKVQHNNKELSSKIDSEFWEDCKDTKGKSKEDVNNSKDEYLTCKKKI